MTDTIQTKSWSELLDNYISLLKERLFTENEFSKCIMDIIDHPESPVSCLAYIIEYNKNIYTIGKSSEDYKHPIKLGNTNVTMTYTLKKNLNIAGEYTSKLEDIFNRYWKEDCRDTLIGLIRLRTGRADILTNKTITNWRENNQNFSIIFCDVDNFKAFNEKTQGLQRTGNEVIEEISILLQNICRKISIIISHSGDLFIIMMPNSKATDALMLSYEIKQKLYIIKEKLKHHSDPNLIKFANTLSMSFGIYTNENSKAILSLEEIFDLANRAEQDSKKIKNSVRFHIEDTINETKNSLSTNSIEYILDRALCIIKSSLGNNPPFRNIWLNCISKLILYKTGLESYDATINDFLNWTGVKHVQNLLYSQSIKGYIKSQVDYSKSITSIDCAFAISHGIFLSNRTSEKDIHLKLKVNKKHNQIALYINDSVCWSSSDASLFNDDQDNILFDLGKSWHIHKDRLQDSNTSNAILIEIGYDHSDLHGIFAKRINIDDRSIIGGGLPDFWEAVLSDLITYSNMDSNIDAVFFLGDHKITSNTLSKLEIINKWNKAFKYKNEEHDELERLSIKTGIPVSKIRNSTNYLENKIFVIEDEIKLWPKLASLMKERKVINSFNDEEEHINQKFLIRQLEMQSLLLAKEDGCKIDTIYEAFPLVLEILRQSDSGKIIKDRGGEQLKEFLGFKIHLTNPTLNKIPEFYLSDKQKFEDYYKKHFEEKDGLFRSKINGQLKDIINHIVKSINSKDSQYSTRSAILILCSKNKGEQNKSQLSLISIHCIPRFANNIIHLNYIFSWRTVEALIGLPFNLYGSVCFSEHITDEIKKTMKNLRFHEKRIVIGDVIFIANSLHLSTNKNRIELTKKIVNEASI